MTTATVADPSVLEGKQALTQLYLAGTGIAELSFLGAYDKLRALDLASNPITDVRRLEALPLLEYVNLDDTQVVDPSPLVDNAGLGVDDVVSFQGVPEEACQTDGLQSLVDRGVSVLGCGW